MEELGGGEREWIFSFAVGHLVIKLAMTSERERERVVVVVGLEPIFKSADAGILI